MRPFRQEYRECQVRRLLRLNRGIPVDPYRPFDRGSQKDRAVREVHEDQEVQLVHLGRILLDLPYLPVVLLPERLEWQSVRLCYL